MTPYITFFIKKLFILLQLCSKVGLLDATSLEKKIAILDQGLLQKFEGA
jgi:hypothetical protein